MLALTNDWRSHIADFAAASAVALIIIVPPSLYLAARFPVEMWSEQRERVAHLLQDIDGWGRPADFYLTACSPQITSPLVVGVVCLAVAYSLRMWHRDKKQAVLGLSGNQLPCGSEPRREQDPQLHLSRDAGGLPAPARGDHWLVAPGEVSLVTRWRRGGYGDGCCAAVEPVQLCGVYVNGAGLSARVAPIALQCAVILAIVTIALQLDRTTTRRAAAGAIGVAMALILTSSIRANWAAASGQRRDYTSQMALRDAALGLPNSVSRDDVVLVRWRGVRKAHLFVIFWSGVESFEARDSRSVPDRLQTTRQARSVYLLSDTPDDSHPLASIAGRGYLYHLR